MHRRCVQAALFLSRRTYATHSALPTADLARTQSAPLRVLERRAKRFGPLTDNQSDATSSGLTPTDKLKYRRLKATGRLPLTSQGVQMSEQEYKDHINSRRSRIRGLRTTKTVSGKQSKLEVVGQPVYLPNVLFRLIRNHTPAGQTYNPYEATFRVPKNITKTDIRSYLHAVYGLPITYVRTVVYNVGSIQKTQRRNPGSPKHSNYKRAVVGLVDPFYYPLREEDMNIADKEEREVWLEENYGIEERRARFDNMKLLMTPAPMRDPKKGTPVPEASDAVPASKRMTQLHRMRRRVEARKTGRRVPGETVKDVSKGAAASENITTPR